MSNTTLALSFRMFQNGQLVREATLTQGVIKIGKVPSAHLQIQDDAVSRMHAIVEVTGSDVSLIDLGSTRGTFVNGKRINKAKLQSGDAITLGDTRLELSIAPAAATAPATRRTPTATPPPPLPTALTNPALSPTTATPRPADIERVVIDEGYRSAASLATPVAPLRPSVPAQPRATDWNQLAASSDGARPATDRAGDPSPAGASPSTDRLAPVTGEPRIVAAIADAGWRTASFTAASPEPALPEGARAVEVAAMFGDTVIDVKHCLDPRGGKRSPVTWVILVAGIACLAAAGMAFAVSVHTAASNKAALDRWTRVEHKPAYAFRPVLLGAGIDWLAFGGLAVGLVGVSLGITRSRRERTSPYYRIGTASGVELATDSAPAAAFPLIAPSGDDFVFNYAAGIDGELIVDGTATALSELASAGRARPSAAVAGAIEVPIPSRGRIRARAGHTSFVISAVAPPRQHAPSLLARIDGRSLAYVGGSLAAHLALLAILAALPPDESTINMELSGSEGLRDPVAIIGHDDPLPERILDPGDGGGQGSATPGMQLPAGTAGTPDDKLDGRLQVAHTQDVPQMSRQQAIDLARREGLLASDLFRDGFQIASASGDYTSGFDAANVYGPLYGAEGSGRGTFGGGVSGWSTGGGCDVDCGTVGTGNRYVIGSPGRYDGYGPGLHNGRGPGWRPHPGAVPPQVGYPELSGTYDKTIVRRYIRRQLDKITYCYDKQLLAHPGIGGEITISFFIAPGGAVQSAKGAGFDHEVASCLADVIGNIAFPPPGEGGVQVNYPFQFHTSGQ